ncbi:hypothetical protein [Cellulomonas hominis]
METDTGSGAEAQDEPHNFGMYPVSESTDLTPEQCRQLDDSLLGSNTTAYWRARIDALLREPAPVDYGSGLASEIAKLGLDPRMLTMTEPTESDRETQRALDAFALRHHIAESLVRLVHAVITAGTNHDVSIWALIADNRDSGADVVKALRRLVADGVPGLDLFLPVDEAERAQQAPSEEVDDALRVHWQWVDRAMRLLVSDGLDHNAGNNKLKHGFAVRARNNLRIEFTTTPPNSDGTMPLSAFANSVPLIDAHAIEFLERLPGRHSHAGSWEVTVLNVRPTELLAEALMFTVVWSSVVASAASRRFVGRDRSAPAHVGLALGPAPSQVVRKAVGLRQGLTATKSGAPPRPFTVDTGSSTVTLIPQGPGTHGRVVDG